MKLRNRTSMHITTEERIQSKYMDLKFVELFLYLSFVCIAYSMPSYVPYGESLAFAYVFSLTQIMTLQLFHMHKLFLWITVIFATLIPSMQISMAVDNSYSLSTMVWFGGAYMTKEVVFYIHIPRKRDTWNDGIVVLGSVATWLLSGLAIYFVIDLSRNEEPVEKVLYIVNLSTFFVLSRINTSILISAASRRHSGQV